MGSWVASVACPSATAVAQSGGLFDENAADSELEDIPAGQTVSVGSFGQIDLHVKDLEISKVLQLLSIQSQRNIVASRNVAGTISADLYGVEFYEALDAILQPNGYGYREEGNFVYVYTAAEIKEIEESERQLTHRLVRLSYISAADASTFVSPLLSASGSIAATGEASAGFVPSSGDGGANTYAHGETLIVRDYVEVVDEIVSLLAELDVRPKQVLVEATILQAAMEEKNALGVDFNVLADYTMSNFETPLNVVDTLMNPDEIIGEAETVFDAGGPGQTLQSTVGNTLAGESGLKFGILGSEFSVFIRALDRVTDTTVIANPKLLVLNRQKADLLVGGRLGYLSTTATESATTQTVEFLDVGTQLSVRPFVGEEGFIRLELRPSISDGSTASVGGVVIPNETTQELTTNVLIRSGQTIVLGGLFKEDTEASRSQWPFLGNVPIAGNAFKGQEDSSSRSEVIFLIKPSVVKDEALYAAGERAMDSIEQTRLGIRHGLLPWSRSKLIAGHMRDAIEYHRQGDDTKALWYTNLALSLDSSLPEARRLKVELTGQQFNEWPGFNLLQDSIDHMIQDQLGSGGYSATGQLKFEAPTTSANVRDIEDIEAVKPRQDISKSDGPGSSMWDIPAVDPTAHTEPKTSSATATPVRVEAQLKQNNTQASVTPSQPAKMVEKPAPSSPTPASPAQSSPASASNTRSGRSAQTDLPSESTPSPSQAQSQPTPEMEPIEVVEREVKLLPESEIVDIESREVTAEDLGDRLPESAENPTDRNESTANAEQSSQE